jgi:hypothetical protein
MKKEKNPYPGRIKVKIVFDPKFGEVQFEIEETNIKNKCLFDALSEHGIELERAKYIVQDMAKCTNTGKFYHLEPIDYVKYGRQRRYEAEEQYQARFGPAQL